VQADPCRPELRVSGHASLDTTPICTHAAAIPGSLAP